MQLHKTIDTYYNRRGLLDVNARQAFLWLLSEVGELSLAVLSRNGEQFTPEERATLQAMVRIGIQAEGHVTGDASWVRNNDHASGKQNIVHEVGDVFMMLERASMRMLRLEPEECLVQKMAAKGFETVMLRASEFQEVPPAD